MRKVIICVLITCFAFILPFRAYADSEPDSSEVVEVVGEADTDSRSDEEENKDDDSSVVDTDTIADAVVSKLAAKNADRAVYYPEYAVYYRDNPRVFIVLVLNFLMLVLIYRRILSKGGARL